MGGAFGRIARLLRRPTPEPGDPVSDAELLGRFVRSADQSAFELLVWRHAVMVFGVCRRIVRDEHLAEDAFQAVFMVLARKAGSVRGSNLAGWLFRVARRVAVRARTRADTRATRETPLAAEPAAPPDASGEVLAILDEEIGRLPERFRLPVVLCYLGGRSTEEAARVLGCPRGTVLSRLATARTRLAARLTRRGVTVPAALFTVAAVPSGLGAVAALVAPAMRLAVGRSAGVGSAAVVLADGVIMSMSIAKSITVAGVFVLAVGLVTGVGLVAADDAAQEGKTKAVRPPEKAKLPAATPARNTPAAAREEQIVRLERLAAQFKDEIEARERDIRHRAETGMLSGLEIDKSEGARLDRMLAKLDEEISALEMDLLSTEVQLELLQRKLVAADRVEVNEADIAREIETDPRVAGLLSQRNSLRIKYEQVAAMFGADSPTLVELKREIATVDKSLGDLRSQIRPEIAARIKVLALKPLKEKMADLEDKRAVTKKVLELREKHRNKLEQLRRTQAQTAAEIAPLLRELEPQRQQLRKIEEQLLELRVRQELTAPSRPEGTDAKLDHLIREVEELRREVRNLKKQ